MNDELKEKLKLTIAISKMKEEERIAMEKRKFNWKKGLGIAACLIVSITGVSYAAVNFSKNEAKEDNFRGLGKGIETAIDYGYIEETNMDYTKQVTSVVDGEKIVDNVSVEAKVNNFLMDDRNISLEFEFVFGENIDEYVDFVKYPKFFMNDLVIRDETDRDIVEGGGNSSFVKSRDGESHTMIVICNVFGEDFPKSRELKLSFRKLSISDEQYEKTVTIVGDWKIDLEVPEKMYHRTDEYYRVVSCSNPDFDIYTSKVTDTGFEIGTIINHVQPREEYPEELKIAKNEIYAKYGLDPNAAIPCYTDKSTLSEEEIEKIENIMKAEEEWFKVSNEEEYLKLTLKWMLSSSPIDTSGEDGKIEKWIETGIKSEETMTKSYIENDKGERFDFSTSLSRKCNTNYIEEDKYDFYDTFEMTKADSTDNVKVVLYYYGEPVTIELEKMK